MQALTLPARRGSGWLFEGFGVYRKKPWALSLVVSGYWIVMVLISSVPWLGQIAGPLLIPAFSVSLMNACRLVAQGEPLPPLLLFSGFKNNVRPLLQLGVIYIVFCLCMIGIISVFDDGMLYRLLVLGERPSREAMVDNQAVFMIRLVVFFAPLMVAYWFAPVLAAWHDLSAGKALFFSVVACLRNWRAFIVYIVSIYFFRGAAACSRGSFARHRICECWRGICRGLDDVDSSCRAAGNLRQFLRQLSRHFYLHR